MPFSLGAWVRKRIAGSQAIWRSTCTEKFHLGRRGRGCEEKERAFSRGSAHLVLWYQLCVPHEKQGWEDSGINLFVCFGVTSDDATMLKAYSSSAFRKYSWQYLGDHIKCQRSNPG